MSEIEFRIGGRKTSKTTSMLEWLMDAPMGEKRVLVSGTHLRSELARKKAQEMKLGLQNWQFRSLDQVRNGGLRGNDYILGVDDLDLMLYGFFGQPVRRVTATGVKV